MPLIKGKKSIGKNIKTLKSEGKPQGSGRCYRYANGKRHEDGR
jgi:hypothetical protein